MCYNIKTQTFLPTKHTLSQLFSISIFKIYKVNLQTPCYAYLCGWMNQVRPVQVILGRGHACSERRLLVSNGFLSSSRNLALNKSNVVVWQHYVAAVQGAKLLDETVTCAHAVISACAQGTGRPELTGSDGRPTAIVFPLIAHNNLPMFGLVSPRLHGCCLTGGLRANMHGIYLYMVILPPFQLPNYTSFNFFNLKFDQSFY